MTSSALNDYSCKDLAQMARSKGVPGWHSMRKDQLIRALIKQSRAKLSQRKNTNSKLSSASKIARREKLGRKATGRRASSAAAAKAVRRRADAPAKVRNPYVARRLQQARIKHEVSKN